MRQLESWRVEPRMKSLERLVGLLTGRGDRVYCIIGNQCQVCLLWYRVQTIQSFDKISILNVHSWMQKFVNFYENFGFPKFLKQPEKNLGKFLCIVSMLCGVDEMTAPYPVIMKG